MEAPNIEPIKLPDMVMCGDHPSFTTTEQSLKDVKMEDKEKAKLKDKPVLSYAKLTPSISRTEALVSEHALRRRERDRPAHVSAPAPATSLAHAFPWVAVGSFRWPPYLVAAWVLVLVVTHVLHSLASVLERALPVVKNLSLYLRTWTEETWKSDTEMNHQKIYPIGLGILTAILYTIYVALYSLHKVAVWAIEPLAADLVDEEHMDVESKVTDYVDEVVNKMNKTSGNMKQQ